MKRPIACLAALGLALAGCGSPGSVVDSFRDGDVTTSAHVGFFAIGSAAYLFAATYGTVAAYVQNASPPPCPKVTDDGTTARIEGGCTDHAGITWLGSATFVRSHGNLVVDTGASPGVTNRIELGTVTFDGFGSKARTDCTKDASVSVEISTTRTGTATISANGAAAATFDIDLRDDGEDTRTSCTPRPIVTAATYTGRLVTNGQGRITLSGSGEVGTSIDGKVKASTTAEVMDLVTCTSEAQSGTTHLVAGGHTAIITYHGAQGCNATASTWTLDGKAEGDLAGIGCATMPGRGGLPGVLSVLTVLGLAGLRRRR